MLSCRFQGRKNIRGSQNLNFTADMGSFLTCNDKLSRSVFAMLDFYRYNSESWMIATLP